mmetsp:Transcript_12648/g.40315  ORF Transcript_12648/g.40315 Transcript_12648/m.40315 type:complete len:209 (+) Transcript_12648:592-1218(+)
MPPCPTTSRSSASTRLRAPPSPRSPCPPASPRSARVPSFAAPPSPPSPSPPGSPRSATEPSPAAARSRQPHLAQLLRLQGLHRPRASKVSRRRRRVDPSLRDFSFKGCTALADVDFPADLSYIGHDAFYNCASLGSVTVPASAQIEEWHGNALAFHPSTTVVRLPAARMRARRRLSLLDARDPPLSHATRRVHSTAPPSRPHFAVSAH